MWQLRKTYAPEKYSLETETPFTRLSELTKDLDSFSRDFDTTFGFGTSTFPPYDEWTEKVDGKTHVFFKFAIAGLSKDSLFVTFKDETNTLKVSYKREKETEDDTKKFTHRGIAKRSFEFTRTLDNNSDYEIVKASTTIEPGCLIVEIEEKKKVDSEKFIRIE